MEFLIFPIFILVAYSYHRADSSYRQTIHSLREMDDSRIEELPSDVYDALTRFSKALPRLIHLNWDFKMTITVGDITWAKNLPAWEKVTETRRWFRISFAAILAFNAAFLYFLLEKSQESEANQPLETTAAPLPFSSFATSADSPLSHVQAHPRLS